MNPTGNGRRDTFRNLPIPRMRATYMEAGNMKEADIISTVKNGIFVDTFTNGQVQIGAGDFTFFVKSGYLIEDGKLTQPIKDINIIGNGPKALADITMVADNDKIDNGTWTCGKDGQSCPVTCGMPSALVSKLTVGGESNVKHRNHELQTIIRKLDTVGNGLCPEKRMPGSQVGAVLQLQRLI